MQLLLLLQLQVVGRWAVVSEEMGSEHHLASRVSHPDAIHYWLVGAQTVFDRCTFIAQGKKGTWLTQNKLSLTSSLYLFASHQPPCQSSSTVLLHNELHDQDQPKWTVSQKLVRVWEKHVNSNQICLQCKLTTTMLGRPRVAITFHTGLELAIQRRFIRICAFSDLVLGHGFAHVSTMLST